MRSWLATMVGTGADAAASGGMSLGLLPVASFDARLEPQLAVFNPNPPFVSLFLRGVGADPAALRKSVVAWLEARAALRQFDGRADAQAKNFRALKAAVAALAAARDAVRQQLAPCNRSLQDEVLARATAYWSADRRATVKQKCEKAGYLHPNSRAGCACGDGGLGNAAEHLRLLLLNEYDALNLPEIRAGATLAEAELSERGFDGQRLWHPGIAMGVDTLAALRLHGFHTGAVNAVATESSSAAGALPSVRFCPLTAVDALLNDGAPINLDEGTASRLHVISGRSGDAPRAPRFLLIRLDTHKERANYVTDLNDTAAVLDAKRWAASASPCLQKGRVRLAPGGAYHSYKPIAALLGDGRHWTSLILDPEDKRWRMYDDLKKTSGGGGAGAPSVFHSNTPKTRMSSPAALHTPSALRGGWSKPRPPAMCSSRHEPLAHPSQSAPPRDRCRAGTGTFIAESSDLTDAPSDAATLKHIAKSGSVFVYRLVEDT
jgi:hypothetical protein